MEEIHEPIKRHIHNHKNSAYATINTVRIHTRIYSQIIGVYTVKNVNKMVDLRSHEVT